MWYTYICIYIYLLFFFFAPKQHKHSQLTNETNACVKWLVNTVVWRRKEELTRVRITGFTQKSPSESLIFKRAEHFSVMRFLRRDITDQKKKREENRGQTQQNSVSGDEEAPPELFHRSEKKSIKATELLLKGCALIAWTLELDFPNALLDFRLCAPKKKREKQNQSDCVILGRAWKSAAPTSARRKTVDHVLGNNKKFFQSRWNRQRLGAIPPTSSRVQTPLGFKKGNLCVRKQNSLFQSSV